MTTLIRGGTIIDAENTYRADVLCADPQDGGTILQIGVTWRRRPAPRSSMQAAST